MTGKYDPRTEKHGELSLEMTPAQAVWLDFIDYIWHKNFYCDMIRYGVDGLVHARVESRLTTPLDKSFMVTLTNVEPHKVFQSRTEWSPTAVSKNAYSSTHGNSCLLLEHQDSERDWHLASKHEFWMLRRASPGTWTSWYTFLTQASYHDYIVRNAL